MDSECSSSKRTGCFDIKSKTWRERERERERSAPPAPTQECQETGQSLGWWWE